MISSAPPVSCPPGIWVLIRSSSLSSFPVGGVSLRCNQWHLLPVDQADAIASVKKASTMAGGVYSQYSVETWASPG